MIEDIAQGLGGGIPFGRAAQAQLAGAGAFGDQPRSGYGPGWRRMAARQDNAEQDHFLPTGKKEGFAAGERVFHQKFGMGNVILVDGDKLEIAFDKAGTKKVVAGFVSKP